MSTAIAMETGGLTLDVLSPTGETTGTVDLPPEIFDVQVNIPLIHQVVVAQLAAARQGTHDTKNRGEVRGGGRKPYRQKGTGRARQGSIRAPHYSGGGVVHGPTPRDYAQRTPKKMKAAALRGALSDRVRSGRVHVVSAVVDGDAPSTRGAATLLARITDRRHVLVVISRDDVLSSRSIRNVQGVHLLYADQLNTYDVLVSDDVVFIEDALAAYIEGALARASRAAGTVYEQDVLVDGLEIDVDGDGETDIEVIFDEPVAIGPDDEIVVVEVTDDEVADAAVEGDDVIAETEALLAEIDAVAPDAAPDNETTDTDEVQS